MVLSALEAPPEEPLEAPEEMLWLIVIAVLPALGPPLKGQPLTGKKRIPGL